MIQYPTVSGIVGVVISKGMATLFDLQEKYSWEDMYDMYECILVNNYNESLLYDS
jgi:hypothetical protein